MVHADGLPHGLIGRLIGKFGNGFHDNAPTSGDTAKWMEPMDLRREIGLEATLMSSNCSLRRRSKGVKKSP